MALLCMLSSLQLPSLASLNRQLPSALWSYCEIIIIVLLPMLLCLPLLPMLLLMTLVVRLSSPHNGSTKSLLYASPSS